MLTVSGRLYSLYSQLLRLIKPGLTVEASYRLQHSKNQHICDASKEETAAVWGDRTHCPYGPDRKDRRLCVILTLASRQCTF